MHVLENYAFVGTGNGFLPVQYQSIMWTNAGLYCQTGLHNFIFGLQTIYHYISAWIF